MGEWLIINTNCISVVTFKLTLKWYNRLFNFFKVTHQSVHCGKVKVSKSDSVSDISDSVQHQQSYDSHARTPSEDFSETANETTNR